MKRIISFFMSLSFILTTFSFIIVVDAASNDSINIPKSAKVFNGHSYVIYSSKKSWHEAKEYCEKMGGHLATITSQEEQTFIESIIKNGTKNLYWLGATDDITEGEWKWVTGEKWNYTNWDIEEPNNMDGEEHYLQIFRVTSPWNDGNFVGKWNDLPSMGKIEEKDFFNINMMGLICEWDNVPLALDKSDVIVKVGKTVVISANVDVTWSASKNYSKTVSLSTDKNKITVKGVANGSVKIIAKDKYGKK